MELSEKQIEDIEGFAALSFTPSEICVLMQLPVEEQLIFMQPGTPFFLAYKKGKLQNEAEIRASIFKLAKNGSAPAQTLAMKIIDDTNKSLPEL